jgi:L-ribulose-5-phosphate 4-epimerase
MDNYNINMDYSSILFKEDVARGTRLLHDSGLSPSGDSGDVSVRDPKTGLIYVSGSPDWCYQKDLRDARGWERTIVDLDGKVYAPWSSPTPEIPMHVEIYRARPDVNAVVHTHGAWASVFAAAAMDIPVALAGTGETGVVPCSRYGKSGGNELPQYVVEALGAYKAALVGNHGAVTVGKTLDEAFAAALWLEAIAEKAFFSLVLAGEHRVDTKAIIEKLSR